MEFAQPISNPWGFPEGTLLVGRVWSKCNDCGRGAFPNQERHEDVAGWHPEPGGGCGVEWKYVVSEYAGKESEEAVRDLRPDLELLNWPKTPKD